VVNLWHGNGILQWSAHLLPLTFMLQAFESAVPQNLLPHRRRLSIPVFCRVLFFNQSHSRLWDCWIHLYLIFLVNWVDGWVQQLEMFVKQLSYFRDCLWSSNIRTHFSSMSPLLISTSNHSSNLFLTFVLALQSLHLRALKFEIIAAAAAAAATIIIIIILTAAHTSTKLHQFRISSFSVFTRSDTQTDAAQKISFTSMSCAGNNKLSTRA